jgi:hypothetical protein
VFCRAAEERAEVARAKGGIGHGHGIRLQRVIPNEGFRIEKEYFALRKNVRDVKWAIEIAPKLIEGEMSYVVGFKGGRIVRVVVIDEVIARLALGGRLCCLITA